MGLMVPAHHAASAAKARLKVKAEAEGRKILRRPFTVRNPIGKRSTIMIDVIHERDPREVLLERMGTIPDGTVMFNRILVAIYQPPRIEKVGNVFITEQATDEDWVENLWQGKVGLVVAHGPQAYVDDEATKFLGQKCEVGDWVWFRPSDGIGCDVNEVFCRVFQERDLLGKLPHPDYVW